MARFSAAPRIRRVSLSVWINDVKSNQEEKGKAKTSESAKGSQTPPMASVQTVKSRLVTS